jgi:hypothetical protein
MTEYVCSNCGTTHTPIEDDVDPWECVECANGLMEPRDGSGVVPEEDLRELIREWRDSMKQRKRDYYAPNGTELAADDLEGVLEEHDV